MNVVNELIQDFKNKKEGIFDLRGQSNLCENNITKRLFELLGRNVNTKSYNNELFGWNRFGTDGCRKIDDTLVIIEVKKINTGSEYGYWHAFSQGLIYSYQQKQSESEKDFLVLCIILDWGRAAGRTLNECEKDILGLFRQHHVYFLRVSMAGKPFIEHNLNGDWSIIE